MLLTFFAARVTLGGGCAPDRPAAAWYLVAVTASGPLKEAGRPLHRVYRGGTLFVDASGAALGQRCPVSVGSGLPPFVHMQQRRNVLFTDQSRLPFVRQHGTSSRVCASRRSSLDLPMQIWRSAPSHVPGGILVFDRSQATPGE
ncbi:hypothetical protein PR202_ga00001 [Eleusine coracana subsp. coracana]|uniref:Uncharacterized protein n=1 Tax=Eleusine coracana subsp. coracana TaxID=191504 RepID=A0AAV5BDA5_ELECO|nr:hypothetical protein PR202_ga00001 [Eleusine coracana subsp. coracana]